VTIVVETGVTIVVETDAIIVVETDAIIEVEMTSAHLAANTRVVAIDVHNEAVLGNPVVGAQRTSVDPVVAEI